MMFLTELAGKMVVNLQDGEVLGDVGDADLLIDETTGEILSILMPSFERNTNGKSLVNSCHYVIGHHSHILF